MSGKPTGAPLVSPDIPAGTTDAGFPDLSGVPSSNKLPEVRPTLYTEAEKDIKKQ
jgi:hypothetical protein